MGSLPLIWINRTGAQKPPAKCPPPISQSEEENHHTCQVLWYFILKSSPAFEHSNPFKRSPDSHFQSGSCPIGIMSNRSLLAFLLSVILTSKLPLLLSKTLWQKCPIWPTPPSLFTPPPPPPPNFNQPALHSTSFSSPDGYVATHGTMVRSDAHTMKHMYWNSNVKGVVNDTTAHSQYV